MPIPQLAMQGIATAANAGMGLLLADINDKRQISQQEKLTQMQLAAQKEGAKYMSDLSFKNQLNMWNATNYEAQMKHIKAAGLNPALIYGTSGPGGQLGAGAGSMSVSGGSASQNPGETQAMIGMGLQIQQQQAQIDLIKAQTEKTQAETKYQTGPATQKTEAETGNLLQGLDNARMDYEIKRLDITMKNILNFEQQASQEDRLDYIEYQAKIATKTLQSATAQGKIDQATADNKIKIINQEAIGAVIKNELLKAGVDNTVINTEATKQSIIKMMAEIEQKWQSLRIDEQEMYIKRYMAEITGKQMNVTTLTDAVRAITGILPKK